MYLGCGWGIREMSIKLQEKLPVGCTYTSGDNTGDRLGASRERSGVDGTIVMALGHGNGRARCP
ncbi:MAG: hypothetical protein JRN37_02795 [Nitrososphaerota archaeon]|nr:hypothetical protein [Nitrososphaerota archaeon]